MSVNPEGSFNGSDNNDDNILIADVVPEELDLMMETAAGDAKEDSTKFEKSDALDGVAERSESFVKISKVQVSEIWNGAGEVPELVHLVRFRNPIVDGRVGVEDLDPSEAL
ncbi:hypothetical protein LINPERHAP2_LOCUS11703 [Linum perenne]